METDVTMMKEDAVRGVKENKKFKVSYFGFFFLIVLPQGRTVNISSVLGVSTTTLLKI